MIRQQTTLSFSPTTSVCARVARPHMCATAASARWISMRAASRWHGVGFLPFGAFTGLTPVRNALLGLPSTVQIRVTSLPVRQRSRRENAPNPLRGFPVGSLSETRWTWPTTMMYLACLCVRAFQCILFDYSLTFLVILRTPLFSTCTFLSLPSFVSAEHVTNHVSPYAFMNYDQT